MKVLIACEFSGVVREAFRARGHDAWSCDLLPAEDDSPHHMRCDVAEILHHGWDLMVAHPPCTDLAVSGARYFKAKGWARQEAALAFVRVLLDAPIERICVENPVSIVSTWIRKPDQIIHPHQFGHDAAKTTCLWLKGLPRLIVDPALAVPPRITDKGARRWANQTDSDGSNRLGPSPDRWKLRAATYQGIANAFALNWG